MNFKKNPILSVIVAVGRGGVIGNKNRLPWHFPTDLRRFRKITLNHPVIMGHKTFLSLNLKSGLPQRENIVLSRSWKNHQKEVKFVQSLEESLRLVKEADEVFIIGGANIYQQTLNLADRLYITHIDLEVEGDKFFPKIDTHRWQKKYQEEVIDEDIVTTFQIYDHQKSKKA